MNRFIKLIVLLLFCSIVKGQTPKKIYFRSGTIQPTKTNLDDLELEKVKAEKTSSALVYKVIQFENIPNNEEKQNLEKQGITLLEYIPENTWIVSISSSTFLTKGSLQKAKVTTLMEVPLDNKIDSSLYTSSVDELPNWALTSNNDSIQLIVSLYKNQSIETAKSILTSQCSNIKKHHTLHALTLTTKANNINNLALINFISFVEPIPEPYKLELYSGTTLHRSTVLKSGILGKKYKGNGIGVSVGDGGKAEFHTDFTGRYVSRTNSGLSDHATHVMGIVGGAGILDPENEGHAPEAMLFTYNGYNDINNINTLYNNDDVRVTNHSLGGGCNGGYNSQARTVDIQTQDYRGLLHVFSAGNSGRDNCGQYQTGYGNITGGYKAGKNVIATGNLTSTDGLSSSSSRGPTPDGRIKPDICAKGSGVKSTDLDNTYSSKSGTSMAAPSAAGTIAQLLEAFKDLENREATNSEMKAIVLNSAEDLGRPGPDYQYGWGRINAYKAFQVIKEKRHFTNNIQNGQTKQHTISIPQNTKQAKIMIYWTDVEGSTSSSRALVNNLDMTVTTPQNQTVFPWVLNPNNVTGNAFRGVDNLNNVEQVTIENPTSGNYTINVTGSQVPFGPQEYVIISDFIKDEITVTSPAGGESLDHNINHYIRWDAHGNTGTFRLEYSVNNGSSWNTISSNVDGARRHYFWNIPGVTTGKALIRVSRNSISDVSDGTFSISERAEGLQLDWVCDNTFQVSWNPVAGATSYDILKLGQSKMDSVGNTSSTSFILNTSSFQTDFVAIRPRNNDGMVGMRTAVLEKSNNFGCTGTDLSIVKINAPTNAQISCNNTASNTNVSVAVKNNGVNPISSIELSYKLNNDNTVTETFIVSLNTDDETILTFNQSLTLPNSGTHNLVISSVVDQDQVPTNNSITVNLELTPSNSKMPLRTNFEIEAVCNVATDCGETSCPLTSEWENLPNGIEDHIDWRVNSGATPSNNTGPESDHTTNSDNGKYIYLEASGSCTYKEAILVSPCLDLNGLSAPTLSFWYHMNGVNMGELHVDLITNGITYTDITSPLVGDQGNLWKNKTVDLSQYTGNNVRIVIRGITGIGYTSDIALDDILISVENDIAITSILKPTSGQVTCGSQQTTPQFSVANFGSDTINSFDLTYSIDNNNSPVTSYNFSIAPNESITLNGNPIPLLTDGLHEISVEVSNPNGVTDQNSKNDVINKTFEVQTIAKPTADNQLLCNPDQVSLTATGNGGEFEWYNAPTNGDLLYKGETYDFFAQNSSVVYLQENNPNYLEQVGPQDTTQAGGGFHQGGFYSIFDVYKPFILKTVTVYAQGSKYRTLTLTDSLGVIIKQEDFFIEDGKQKINLNWQINKGLNYRIGAETNADLYRSTEQINYPYTLTDILTIKQSTAGSDPFGFFYYLYDWQVLPIIEAGAETNEFGAGGFHQGGFYLVFDALESFTLKSAKVYADGTKERTLELKNSNDDVVATKKIMIPNGESEVVLDLQVPKGTDYKIGFANGADLYRNNDGISFPYITPGIVNIKQSTATSNPFGFYYYLYNWKIEPFNFECSSQRTEVTITIDKCTGLTEESIYGLETYPNPVSSNINIEYPEDHKFESLTIIDITGRTVFNTNKPLKQLSVDGLSNGIYIIQFNFEGKQVSKKIVKE